MEQVVAAARRSGAADRHFRCHPIPVLALAEADLAVTRRILICCPGGRPLRARWLNWLGVTLAQTGQAPALPKQEAVAIRRELAAANPDRYRPDLASR